MAAIKLSQENAAVLQVGETGISLPELIRQYQPARLLLFGLQPKDVRLHINTALYKPMAWNGCTILWADSLPKLDQDPTRKRTLWAALQSLYLA